MDGEIVKNMRKISGLTQQEFSDLMDVTKRTVARWETLDEIPMNIGIEIQRSFLERFSQLAAEGVTIEADKRHEVARFLGKDPWEKLPGEVGESSVEYVAMGPDERAKKVGLLTEWILQDPELAPLAIEIAQKFVENKNE